MFQSYPQDVPQVDTPYGQMPNGRFKTENSHRSFNKRQVCSLLLILSCLVQSTKTPKKFHFTRSNSRPSISSSYGGGTARSLALASSILIIYLPLSVTKDFHPRTPNISLAPTATPVSYTHLDVYKRQRIICTIIIYCER